MSSDLAAATAILWLAGAGLALTGRLLSLVRTALALGCACALALALLRLPAGTPAALLPMRFGGDSIGFQLSPQALWLMAFGLVPAILACMLGSPAPRGHGGWLFGTALSLIGALGTFGVQHGGAFLVAWELMSLGSAVMLLSEGLTEPGRPVLFMLSLLEVGAIALLLGILVFGRFAGDLDFTQFAEAGRHMPPALAAVVGVLFIIGFGAKLGLLPFYEWYPSAYQAGSGASGAVLSGVVLNAAFFALSRTLLDWVSLAPAGIGYGLGIFVTLVGVVSAILTILYAFQQDDWRGLLAFSSAENAAIAVTMLGAATLFRAAGATELAGLAWTVSLLHLAGHSLAKGALFLAADGVYRAEGAYAIRQRLLSHRAAWIFGVGALFAAMSLAAMPPQAGFISKWFAFQTVFQGFRLPGMGGRLVLAFAGAGLALTAAIAFATFVKAFGIGLLGGGRAAETRVPPPTALVVGILGLCLIVFAIGMPAWLGELTHAAAKTLGSTAPQRMHDGLLLVPLTAKFAFISPTKLVIAMPLLALIPIALVLLSAHARSPRRTAVWYGGAARPTRPTATTALTFSNALRTFYSFVYRPTDTTTRAADGNGYFIRGLTFRYDVTPIFGPHLYAPTVRTVNKLASTLRGLQSGYLNIYLAMIGILLVIILALTLL